MTRHLLEKFICFQLAMRTAAAGSFRWRRAAELQEAAGTAGDNTGVGLHAKRLACVQGVV